MGFMAGFGQAFSQSFNDYNTQQAQKQEDAFKLQYQDYITRRDANEAIDRENAKTLKLAKALVKTSGKPDEAVYDVYDMLAGGAKPEDVRSILEQSSVSVKQKGSTPDIPAGQDASQAAVADPRDALGQQAQTAVQTQMNTSGMAGKGGQTAQGGIFGDLKGVMHDALSSQGMTDRAATRAHGQMLGVAGVSEEDYKKQIAPRVAASDIPGRDDVETQWSYNPFGGQFGGDQQAQMSTGSPALDKMMADADTPAKAAIFVEQAQRYGDPKVIQIAQDHQHRINAVAGETAQRTAVANGTGFIYQRGFVRDGKGGWTGKQAYPDYSQDPINPTWKDDAGNPVPTELVAPVGKDQEADMKKIADEGSDDMKSYGENKLAYKDFVNSASDYIDAMKNAKGQLSGESMDIAGNISQTVDRYRRAALNVLGIVDGSGNVVQGATDSESALATLDSQAKKIQDELAHTNVGDRISTNALKASLIDIQGIKLAYQMAAQANGSTKGISNQDVKHYIDVVSGNGNPVTAAKGLSIFAKQMRTSLTNQEKSVQTGKGAASYYKNKYHGAPSGFSVDSTVDTETASDQAFAKKVKNLDFDASTDTDPGSQVNPPAKETKIPDWAQNAGKPIIGLGGREITPGMWPNMSPELIEAIKKKNGF